MKAFPDIIKITAHDLRENITKAEEKLYIIIIICIDTCMINIQKNYK